jgi:hypothetical protein
MMSWADVCSMEMSKLEIRQTPTLPVVDQDVGWFDIVMQNAAHMQARETEKGIQKHAAHLISP